MDLVPICYSIFGLGHSSDKLLYLPSVEMPPKKKAAEVREDVREDPALDRDIIEGELITSPLSSAASYSTASSLSSRSTTSSISLSSEQLESILAANSRNLQASSAKMMEINQKAMADLVASLSPASAGSRPTRSVQVKPPKWSDEDTPFEYFGKYEKAMLHNGVERSAWGTLLPVYLAGRAQAALAQVNVDELSEYDKVKATLMESLGDTPASADRKWWSLARLPGEEPGSFYLRVRAIGLRRLYGLSTVGEITEQVILSRYLSLLPAECYSVVVGKSPKSGLEASRMVQEFEETRSFARKRQPWKDNYQHRREPSVNSAGGSSSSGSGTPVVDSSSKPSGGAASKSGKSERSGRKPIICHGCGEPGHIKPNCPHRVRRVKSPEPSSLMMVKGRLAGSMMSGLRVDTGADRTLVREDCIPEGAYTGETIMLDSWRGSQFSKHRVALITIEVEGVSVQAKVAVVTQLDCPALLGRDLGAKMTVKLLSMVLERAKENDTDSEVDVVTKQEVVSQVVSSEVVRVTRAQAEKARKEEVADELASASSGSDPLPLESIFGFDDELFEDEVLKEGMAVSDLVPTPLNECEGLMENGPADIPLPNLNVADRDSLSSEQEADPTLKAQRLLASKREKGYSFEKGILIHTTFDGLGDECKRILVPKGRRKKVLELAHTHILAGHFGRKKTFVRLSGRFLWPRM